MKRAILIFAIGAIFGVALAPAAIITGTIVDDATGKPISTPSVRVFGGPRYSNEVTVRGDGSFETEDLKPGDYTVATGQRGYVYTAMSVHMGSEVGLPLVVRLVRLGAIEGKLTGLQGWVGRVTALSRSVDKATGNEIWKPVRDEIWRPDPVDNDGNFRIADLPPGSYAILVAYSNSGILRYPEGKGVLELKGDGATLKVIVPIPGLAATRTVEGRIELPDPQDWYWVTLSNQAQPALAVATTTTDDKGAFAFRGIVPGAYEVLASPGQGERGSPPVESPPYHGFARAAVDLREHDASGIVIHPRDSIPASIALQESVAMPGTDRCFNTDVTLMPLEDWGVRMERIEPLFKISNDGLSLVPQSFDGLAPAKYGVSTGSVSGRCLVAGHPVLDLTGAASVSLEAKVREPGTVRGHADPGVDVILIPEDFAGGWSWLPAAWFAQRSFGSDLHFKIQQFGGDSGPFLPHVRIATSGADGGFEIRYVPAGGYRIAVRPTGPAPDWEGMKQLDALPAGIATIELAVPPAR